MTHRTHETFWVRPSIDDPRVVCRAFALGNGFHMERYDADSGRWVWYAELADYLAGELAGGDQVTRELAELALTRLGIAPDVLALPPAADDDPALRAHAERVGEARARMRARKLAIPVPPDIERLDDFAAQRGL